MILVILLCFLVSAATSDQNASQTCYKNTVSAEVEAIVPPFSSVGLNCLMGISSDNENELNDYTEIHLNFSSLSVTSATFNLLLFNLTDLSGLQCFEAWSINNLIDLDELPCHDIQKKPLHGTTCLNYSTCNALGGQLVIGSIGQTQTLSEIMVFFQNPNNETLEIITQTKMKTKHSSNNFYLNLLLYVLFLCQVLVWAAAFFIVKKICKATRTQLFKDLLTNDREKLPGTY